MDRSAKKRKKVSLLFFLGIGLPSLLLGYLAFRGIQNDRALFEKRKLDEHRRASESIINSIEQELSRVEQNCLAVIFSRSERDDLSFRSSLKELKSRYPHVEEIFVLRGLDTIHFPAAELLYLPDGAAEQQSSPPRRSSIAGTLRNGQRLEFRQQKHREALSLYQRALDKAEDTRSKGECLNAIARVQKKAGLHEEAAATYRMIVRDYGQIRITNGLPLGLAARMELGSLIKETPRALEVFVELYRALIQKRWILEKGQYEFFSHSVKTSIEEILSRETLPSQSPVNEESFQNLESAERKEIDRAERLLLFQQSAARDLQAKLPRDRNESPLQARRGIVELGRNAYLVSLLNPPGAPEKDNTEIWGLLFDAKHLKDPILKHALQEHLSPENTSWIVRGRDGRTVLTSEHIPAGSLTVRADFGGNFPDWTLEFYHEDPWHFVTFLTSRRGIYFYMFLLIGGILIFGLILTIRTVNHELELAKMKSDFVSTVSHEFKSPLTSIRQLAEMLQTGRVPSEESRRKYYDTLLEQSERLSLLTENVLNFARMEEGKKEFEFVENDVGMLLNKIVSPIRDRLGHEEFEIELQTDNSLQSVFLDSETIAQAVTNLIDNAVKYSGNSKTVLVKAFRGNGHLVIAVQDFGVGIRKEELGRVFERFYRGGNALTRTVKGSGLGLTLVKRIVEAHRGTVAVKSAPGCGSTFSIRLPFK